MSHKNRSIRKANKKRLDAIDQYRGAMDVLPIEEQHRRRDERKATHQSMYPNPPKYDEFAHVRGNPDLRGEVPVNQPKPTVQDLGLADLLAIFDVVGTRTRRRKQGGS